MRAVSEINRIHPHVYDLHSSKTSTNFSYIRLLIEVH